MYMNIRPQDNNFFISFPSSGQHLIERLFEEIYGYYLPTYYSYCEYYTCCKMIPCAHNKTFNKNHDMDCDLEIVDEYKYLVLYRGDVIRQLEAWWRWSKTSYKRSKTNIAWELTKKIDYDDIEIFNQLFRHINNNQRYYFDFIEKWVHSNRSNCLVVEYYDFVKDPVSKLVQMLKFFNHIDDVKEEDIRRIINDRDEKILIFGKNHLDKRIYNRIKNELIDQMY